MGCISSRSSPEPGPDPVASHLSLEHTHQAREVKEATGRLVLDAEETGSPLLPHIEGRKVIVNGMGHLCIRSHCRTHIIADICVECLKEDVTHMDGLILTIVGLDEETSGPMERVSPTEWTWPSIITLYVVSVHLI